MVLTIYVKKIPKGCDFVFDVEALFKYISLKDDVFIRRVLKDVEQCKIINPTAVMDRVGHVLPVRNISTGVKAVLLNHYFPEKVINCTEVGDNLLKYLTDGSIYFMVPSKTVDDNTKVLYNGQNMSGYEFNIMPKELD